MAESEVANETIGKKIDELQGALPTHIQTLDYLRGKAPSSLKRSDVYPESLMMNYSMFYPFEISQGNSLTNTSASSESNTAKPTLSLNTVPALTAVNVVQPLGLKASAQPKAAEPKAAEPKAAQPKANEPKANEPKANEPKANEPKANEPKASDLTPEELKMVTELYNLGASPPGWSFEWKGNSDDYILKNRGGKERNNIRKTNSGSEPTEEYLKEFIEFKKTRSIKEFYEGSLLTDDEKKLMDTMNKRDELPPGWDYDEATKTFKNFAGLEDEDPRDDAIKYESEFRLAKLEDRKEFDKTMKVASAQGPAVVEKAALVANKNPNKSVAPKGFTVTPPEGAKGIPLKTSSVNDAIAAAKAASEGRANSRRLTGGAKSSSKPKKLTRRKH
jgi:hypothetical protein